MPGKAIGFCVRLPASLTPTRGLIKLDGSGFASGSLKVVSYARPGKFFTANRNLMVRQVGVLKDSALKQVVDAVIKLLRAGLKL
jgi:hypothetical protein